MGGREVSRGISNV